MTRIEQAGSPQQLIHDIGRRGGGVLSTATPPDLALALEISVNEEAERERLARDVGMPERAGARRRSRPRSLMAS